MGGAVIPVRGQYHLRGRLHQVWELLLDPEALRACLPGCEGLVPTPVPHHYEVVMTVGVAVFRGRYTGKVVVRDVEPFHRYRLEVEGRGAGGVVHGEGVITLQEDGEGTRVAVEGQVRLGGLIAGMGQRVAGGVARMLMDHFFACVQKRLG
jgi:carbon monoxide dehydrogenase subunit G